MVFDDTIAAVSTPAGVGAIAIVRLSGPRAVALADRVFRGKTELKKARSHTVHYGRIYDPRKEEQIDEVLISLMRSPATYTGEDIVEVSCHGGVLNTKRILELMLQQGARLASPGEFTKRAFLNGRLDLAQAEAVVDVICSKSERSLKMAQRQLSGGLSEEIGRIRRGVIDALALMEANLDFSDQEVAIDAAEQAQQPLRDAQKEISLLLRGALFGQQLREGFSVAIVGRPNVGKSSLFNALLKSDRAIVTHIPGTTRDTISEQVDLQGVPVRLADTAGLHTGEGLVEKEGVQRTRQLLSAADLLLVVLDGSEALKEEDRHIIQETEERKSIVVINKEDLTQVLRQGELDKLAPSRIKICVSAKKGDGIDRVTQMLGRELLNGHGSNGSEPMVSRVRHQEALRRAQRTVGRARRRMQRGGNEEIVAEDLREALSALGEITGEGHNEEILDRIFSQFCVGK